MLDTVKGLYQELEQYAITTPEQLEQFRMRFISRKGVITELFEQLKQVPQADRRTVGQELNGLKNFAQEQFDRFNQLIDEQQAATNTAPPQLT